MIKANKVIHLLLFTVVSLLTLSGFSSKATAKDAYEILNATTAVNFAPDGRLWRLIPTADNVFVDYSTDEGKTYSAPVKINPGEQEISAWPENPPAIAISRSGQINVLYYADEQQKTTAFYSFSTDNGKTFSAPVRISDRADTARHYMAEMLLDNKDTMYLFWHDTRHADSRDHHTTNNGIALYYTVTHSSNKPAFINQFLSDDICSCCRTAVALAPDGLPVLFARMILKDNIRDHALLKMNAAGKWSSPQQVTVDNWQIDACPEHGPALAIDSKNRSHLTWFTLGEKRQGIYYAKTDDYGKTVSEPLSIGDKDKLASHPDVIALGNQVVIAWQQFDGEKTTIHFKTSTDRGETWAQEQVIFSTTSKTGYPSLVTNGKKLFLSIASDEQGHQLIKIP